MDSRKNIVWALVIREVYVGARVILKADQYVSLTVNALYVLIKEDVDAATGAKFE